MSLAAVPDTKEVRRNSVNCYDAKARFQFRRTAKFDGDHRLGFKWSQSDRNRKRTHRLANVSISAAATHVVGFFPTSHEGPIRRKLFPPRPAYGSISAERTPRREEEISRVGGSLPSKIAGSLLPLRVATCEVAKA